MIRLIRHDMTRKPGNGARTLAEGSDPSAREIGRSTAGHRLSCVRERALLVQSTYHDP